VTARLNGQTNTLEVIFSPISGTHGVTKSRILIKLIINYSLPLSRHWWHCQDHEFKGQGHIQHIPKMHFSSVRISRSTACCRRLSSYDLISFESWTSHNFSTAIEDLIRQLNTTHSITFRERKQAELYRMGKSRRRGYHQAVPTPLQRL